MEHAATQRAFTNLSPQMLQMTDRRSGRRARQSAAFFHGCDDVPSRLAIHVGELGEPRDAPPNRVAGCSRWRKSKGSQECRVCAVASHLVNGSACYWTSDGVREVVHVRGCTAEYASMLSLLEAMLCGPSPAPCSYDQPRVYGGAAPELADHGREHVVDVIRWWVVVAGEMCNERRDATAQCCVYAFWVAGFRELPQEGGL